MIQEFGKGNRMVRVSSVIFPVNKKKTFTLNQKGRKI